MGKDIFKIAIDSVKKEPGVSGAAIFDLNGTIVCENIEESDWDYARMQVKDLIDLSQTSQVDSKEIHFDLSEKKFICFFLLNEFYQFIVSQMWT